MPFFSPEVIEQVRQIDLLTYLERYEPQELVHFSGNTYCTKTHDSLKISNGKWCWWSRGIGGTSALDYLIKVQGLSFIDAMQALVGMSGALLNRPISDPAPVQPKKLVLPKPNRYAYNAVRYLEGRGIDGGLIEFCLQTERVYEADIFVEKLKRAFTNVVFIGSDRKGEPRYVGLRGIGTDFKGDYTGSDKHYSFGIPSETPSPVLHLFESAIDLLSYATLQKMEGKNWNAENLLSLAGIYLPKKNIEESTVPAALKQYLSDYPHIEKIVLRLDNDPPGRLAAKTLKTILPKQYAVEAEPPPQGKDYNDCLMLQLGRRPITVEKQKRSLER
jgi:hypothetical protein